MAAEIHTLKSVLRAHNSPVNGVCSLGPNLDDASELLRQAHGALVVAATAVEDGVLNPSVIAAALNAAQTLLEIGLRNMDEGYEVMLRDKRRAN